MDYLKNFHGFEEWSKNSETVKVKQKLSDISDKIDFLKIDVQGYESEIIKYGEDKIKDCLVLQLETSPLHYI